MTNRRAVAHTRKGFVAVKIAIVAGLLFGMAALSVDVGYVAYTKTQLQAAADAATLSGGTELMAGLGDFAVAAATVAQNAKSVSVDFAGRNPNGNQTASYADPNRTSPYADVRLGWAIYDNAAGQWQMNWGQQLPDVGGYNLIGVTLRRDQTSGNSGDGLLPLSFARIFGRASTSLVVDAAAVILPSNGLVITPGSDETGNAMPFALRQRQWQKYLDVQEWYELNNNGYGASGPLTTTLVDPDHADADPALGNYVGPWYDPANRTVVAYNTANPNPDHVPLFGYLTTPSGGQDPEFVQEFDDAWDWNGGAGNPFTDPLPQTDPPTVPIPGSDGVLEYDVYPHDLDAGNFGTIDIGSDSNGTPDLISQILDGVTAEDLATWSAENNDSDFVLPVTTTGDTGISGGIDAGHNGALTSIAGDCRAVYLFDALRDVGNNKEFDLVDIGGIRIIHTELNGNDEVVHLLVQMCNVTATGSTGDDDTQIGQDTTVFTPLILID